MAVLNVHERILQADGERVGGLVDSLASGAEDRLWPYASWPAMRLDPSLSAGARGGHGPIRYTVSAYEPGVRARFEFTGPRGFDGYHEFTVHPLEDGERTLLRHTLAMTVHGPARVSWPLVFRWLHDALAEDALDRAELACSGTVARPARWSPYVHLLRGVITRLPRR
ncbi:SRPBCC family protein [Streptomyces sp. TBY4]|uniref:SRPBCC family protein n=1 Tax=Streptomyces sp. TBY4 TaxID=2962030 RepID=UPI0020B7F37D|nr:SRPBCC family protein [Streptomyces sp. TBY4]MCP3756550.1 SRPBCC family protein [Streptomyces sp. TBY4]